MKAFFDTSAIVPLIFQEPHTEKARRVWQDSSLRIGWQWLRVEAEAAIHRRRGDAEAWTLWKTIERSMHWIEPDEDWLQPLKSFNRGIGLRAADAGHLFLMESCSNQIPDLALATYDKEMHQAAVARGIAVLES